MRVDFEFGALRRLGLGLLLLAAAQLAHASVVNGNYSFSGVRQGHRGDAVSLSLDESALAGFQGAELTFTFNSDVLDFIGAGPTDPNASVFADAQPISDTGGLATYSLFVAVNSGGDLNGVQQLFTLFFDIDSAAAIGPTSIQFTNDVTDFSDPSNAGIYDRVGPFSGTIDVLPSAATVPEGNALVLTLTALGLMAWIRRKRRRPDPVFGLAAI